MFELIEQTIATPGPVRSLVWHNDTLIDFASGGDVYGLDGSYRDGPVRYGYRFDAAIISPTGRFALLHERLGTKGVILRGGDIVKEVDRSYYFADAYEFPAVFATLADGREVMFHCPHEYNQIEALDVETGNPVAATPATRDDDFFHSRLCVSPRGRWLASAGWVWHPDGPVDGLPDS